MSGLLPNMPDNKETNADFSVLRATKLAELSAKELQMSEMIRNHEEHIRKCEERHRQNMNNLRFAYELDLRDLRMKTLELKIELVNLKEIEQKGTRNHEGLLPIPSSLLMKRPSMAPGPPPALFTVPPPPIAPIKRSEPVLDTPPDDDQQFLFGLSEKVQKRLHEAIELKHARVDTIIEKIKDQQQNEYKEWVAQQTETIRVGVFSTYVTVFVDCQKTDTIAHLKAESMSKIMQSLISSNVSARFRYARILLWYGNVELKYDDLTLADYGISHGFDCNAWLTA